jgi:cold shock CspA family protein/KaiC/GvpD/RAD55 family RecA-like ATPase
MTREEFEEDAKIGEILRFKTQDCEFVGKIDSFGTSGVKIIDINTNKPKRIVYENILEYDFDVDESEKKKPEILNTFGQNISLVDNNNLNVPKKIKINEVIESRIKDFQSVTTDSTLDFSFDTIFKLVNSKISDEQKREFSKIKSKLIDAKRIHEDGFEHSKIRQIFKQINELIVSGCKEANALKGSLLYEYGKSESSECFLNAGLYNYGFYSAKSFRDSDAKICAALLSIKDNQYDKEIVSFLAEYSDINNKTEYLRYAIENVKEFKLDLLLIYFRNDDCFVNLPDLENIDSEKNDSYLKNLYEKRTPLDTSEINGLLQKYSLKNTEIQNQKEANRKKGCITHFNSEKLFGFIGNVFFHIRQISDESLQKKLLKNGTSKLQVSYLLGRTAQGKIAAYDVKLIDQKASEVSNESNLNGKISEYKIFDGFGIINYLTKSYRFNFDNVKDILLAKILDSRIEKFPIDILFDIETIVDKNKIKKNVAVNVRLTNEPSKEKINQMIKSNLISESDFENWRNARQETFNDDTSYTFDYVPLIPLEDEVDVQKAPSTTVGNYYFEMARQADTYDKNLDRAISNYKKAIELKQNLSASVLNLVLIYSRLEMKQEALTLLENYKSELEYSRYLNTKIQVLQKDIEKKYAKELIDCLNEAKEKAITSEKRLLLSMNIGSVYFRTDDFDKAEETFKDILTNRYIDSQQRKSVLTSLCNIKLKKSDDNQAKEYANKILMEFPEDAFALSVINNTYSTEGDIAEAYLDYSNGSEISHFILDKIEQLNLITELKSSKKINDDNVFIGSEKDAETLMIALTKQETGNDGVKANQRYARAKIIKQIMERNSYKGENTHINENEYLLNIAYGSYFSGNQRLYNISSDLRKNIDSSRYLYLESAKILKDSEKIHSCWHLSVLSFFKTFFSDDEATIKRLPTQKKDTQNPSNDFLTELSKILADNLILSTKIFASGIFECIEYDERNKKLIIECLGKSHLKQLLTEELTNLYKKDIEDDFYTLVTEAFNKYISIRASYLRVVTSTINNLYSFVDLSSNLDKIKNSEFLEYLNQTDKGILNMLFEIFGKLLKYNEATDFDYKSDMLRAANEERDLLEEHISKNPTRFGYDLLLPHIKDLQGKIYNESQSLYESSIPEIDIKIDKDSVTLDPEQKTVSFVVNFTNKVNVQNADNVKISVESNKTKNLANEELGKNLIKGDGKSLQRLCKFEVTEDLIKEKFLPISISVSYEYFKNMNDKLSKEDRAEISVPLSKEKFEPIDNKFAKYRDGSPVKDDDMFFGRAKDIERIISQVCDSEGKIHSGKSLALYGQTRTGKSSLLYHVEKKLREKDSERNIIINIGSIGELDLSSGMYEFLYAVLDQLKTELSHNHKDFYKVLEKSGTVIDPDLLEEDKVQAQFNKMFKDLCRYIQEKNTGHNIILMIDEFTYVYDWIRQGTMTDRFMKFWKGFIQNNDIYAIIIGQDHMMQFVNDPRFTNDFGSTEQQKVTYLSETDAKKMMEEPIMIKKSDGIESRYKDGALDKLYELSSGSAFLIMKLCAGLVDYINEVIKNPYITIAYIDEYLKNNLSSFEESKYFEPQYSDKSSLNSEEIIEKNKLLLKRIAQLAPRKEWSPIDKVILDESDRKLLDNLEERDVILIEEGQRCKIKVALYKEWILAKYGEKL